VCGLRHIGETVKSESEVCTCSVASAVALSGFSVPFSRPNTKAAAVFVDDLEAGGAGWLVWFDALWLLSHCASWLAKSDAFTGPVLFDVFNARRFEGPRTSNGQSGIRLSEDGGTLDGRVQGSDAVFEAKFMLPWSFSEETAAEKYVPQLPHNMLIVAARTAVLLLITGGG
jgi:hypothetical protein